MKQLIITICTLALLLPSCTNETLLVEDGLEKELIVSAEIASAATQKDTRAASGTSYDKTAFADDDQIKISKSGGGEALYKKSGTRWLPVANQTRLTVTANSSETFMAVYPHDFASILSDQTDGSTHTGDNLTKSNKLKAQASTTATGNSVNFTFAPDFCKMTVTVTFQDARSNVTATLEANNVCTEAGKTGFVQMLRTSSNAAAGKQHSFICIFNPGAYSTYKLTVKSTPGSSSEIENTYTVSTAKTFEKGYNYIYNFTATNELILTGIKVTDFTDEGTKDVGSAT